MGMVEALKIEKIEPLTNGIYVCVDENKKIYKSIKAEDLLLKLIDKDVRLGDLLLKLIEDNQIAKEKLNHQSGALKALAQANNLLSNQIELLKQEVL